MSNHIELNTGKPGRLFSGIWVGLFIMMMSFSCTNKTENASSTSPVVTERNSANPDLKRLIGRWMRPDGGYILEILSATPDGKLDVAYYNPKPIHVARAEWVEKDGKLYVMAELQDVNYPGSIYGLEYKVAIDHLAGTYFQAVEKSTYDVEFVREK
jgi:hypothetical protein